MDLLDAASVIGAASFVENHHEGVGAFAVVPFVSTCNIWAPI